MLIDCPDCDAEVGVTICGRRPATEADLEAVRQAALVMHRRLVHSGALAVKPEPIEEEHRG